MGVAQPRPVRDVSCDDWLGFGIFNGDGDDIQIVHRMCNKALRDPDLKPFEFWQWQKLLKQRTNSIEGCLLFFTTKPEGEPRMEHLNVFFFQGAQQFLHSWLRRICEAPIVRSEMNHPQGLGAGLSCFGEEGHAFA